MPRYAAQIGSTLTGLRRTHAADLGNVGLNVRATDVASNTMTSSVSSDGQGVLPTLTVSISTTTGELGNFNPDNGNTQTKTITVTVSTNAYSGYVVRMYALDFLRSIDNPPVIIPDFSAGTYASPAERSGTGWGFNTDDGDLNGGAFWDRSRMYKESQIRSYQSDRSRRCRRPSHCNDNGGYWPRRIRGLSHDTSSHNEYHAREL